MNDNETIVLTTTTIIKTITLIMITVSIVHWDE